MPLLENGELIVGEDGKPSFSSMTIRVPAGTPVNLLANVHPHGAARPGGVSVFPRIPGFFIVLPIYMISEKATDVILAHARPTPRTPR